MNEEGMETIDTREQDAFFLENELIDVYARILGLNTVGVYCSLCRYANKQQRVWPSQEQIAEELGLSQPTVIECIKRLEHFNLIKKAMDTDMYYLLDKSQWRKKKEVMSAEPTSNSKYHALPERYIQEIEKKHQDHEIP